MTHDRPDGGRRRRNRLHAASLRRGAAPHLHPFRLFHGLTMPYLAYHHHTFLTNVTQPFVLFFYYKTLPAHRHRHGIFMSSRFMQLCVNKIYKTHFNHSPLDATTILAIPPLTQIWNIKILNSQRNIKDTRHPNTENTYYYYYYYSTPSIKKIE